jgi:PAS domain S-box-containing protein
MLKEKENIGEFWQRRIQRNELILRSAGEGIFGIDVEGKISFVNPAAATMLDRKTSNIVGKHYQTILFGEKNDESIDDFGFSPIQFALNDGETSHVISETFYRRDGSNFLVEYICVPLKEKDKIIGAVITFQDITERRDIEVAIVEARNSAIESARTKTAFLANMSHEIRTPLNGVIGMTSLLLDTNLSHEQLHYTNIIKQSADLLLEIVNEILDFSKIEAGKLELEKITFDLSELLNGTIEFFKLEAKRKGLQLKLEIADDFPHIVCGDSSRLRQIFNNLISNAIKFTESGEIIVKVSKESESASEILLKFIVSDTGIGISKDKQDFLFQPFTQADITTTRRFGGTGLGLAISKQLAGMMNGEIGVQSEINQGSSFWFTAEFGKEQTKLPTATAEKSPIFIPNIESHDQDLSSKVQILIAEDNVVNQQVALGMLRSLGFQAHAVANGFEAVNALKALDYELILMDCHMPEMDGFEATREIRSLGNSKKLTKIIAMTANALVGEEECCLEYGMDDYLSKPMSKDDLSKILAKHLPQIEKKLDSETNIVQHRLEDILDKNALENLKQIETRGEKDFIAETISLYFSHAEKQIGEIKQAVFNQISKDLFAKAHSLKGSSGSIGLNKMSKLCENLEIQSQNDDWKSSEQTFKEILTEFERIKTAIAETNETITPELE